MSVLPKIEQESHPQAEYTPQPIPPLDLHLPDESKASRIVVGILVGIPVAAMIGGGLIFLSLMGTPAEAHAAVLSLPFGGMFGILGGAIGGLMSTMRAH